MCRIISGCTHQNVVFYVLDFDESFFAETVQATDQAITKLTIFRNLLVSAEEFTSLKKISYKKVPEQNSFALLIEGDILDEIHEFVDFLPEKMDFIQKSDLLEVQIRI